MREDVDFVVLDGPLGWSDDYELSSTVVELDGYMIADLRSYREGLFESMLSLFEDQTPMRIDAIRAALETSDFEHLRHQAHELAGGAAYVGAASFAAHARAIETRARLEDATGALPYVDALTEHGERTMASLRAILAGAKGDSEP
jgi:HPt (histidine-containing phosphotransfer) domain-containing protein